MVIREATLKDIPSIARVHLDSWRNTYRGIMPDEYLDCLTYEDREQVWTRILGNPESRTVAIVAEDEANRIVGFGAAGPSESNDPSFEGELFALHVVKEHHGKGIGHHLISAVADRLARMGITSMILWVITGNPAYSFYERLGAARLYGREFEFGGVMLSEMGYGWTDTSQLPRPHSPI